MCGSSLINEFINGMLGVANKMKNKNRSNGKEKKNTL